MTPRIQFATDVILTVMLAVSGYTGFLDGLEQLLRITLLFISILSGILLILVNWEKGTGLLKNWVFKKDKNG